ncbi:MAG: diaminopimelate epimerase, partial [Chromatiales bacterium]|nr:diaminopimelate epimerase [Chromatiales bacterium]
IDAEGVVSINMGEPQFEPKHIPFAADGPFVASGPFAADGSQARYRLTVGDEEIELDAVSLGNPHVVIEVDDVDAVPLERLGPAIQASPAFPQGVNVGVVKRHDRSRVVLRVFERGVGETEACGTGACAAVAVLRARQEVDEAVAVDLRGGRLHISWEGFGAPLWMTGPTSYVFEGEIEI